MGSLITRSGFPDWSVVFFSWRKVLAKRFVVCFRSVGFVRGDHNVRCDESGNVINVPVSIVAGNAASQPDDFAMPR